MFSLLDREFDDSTRYPKGDCAHNAVMTTFLVTIEEIFRTDHTAINLLSFISHIEPKAIPRSMLPHTGSEEQMVNAIGLLCGYSFLERRGDSNMFDMHGLVHIARRI